MVGYTYTVARKLMLNKINPTLEQAMRDVRAACIQVGQDEAYIAKVLGQVRDVFRMMSLMAAQRQQMHRAELEKAGKKYHPFELPLPPTMNVEAREREIAHFCRLMALRRLVPEAGILHRTGHPDAAYGYAMEELMGAYSITILFVEVENEKRSTGPARFYPFNPPAD